MVGYKNKKLLYWEYYICQKSLTEIGNLYNTSVRQVCNWMIKFNIPRRSLSESIHLAKINHCKFTKKLSDFIIGGLLGDGNIGLNDSRIHYSAKYRQACKFKEYLEFISSEFESMGIKQGGNINERYHKKLDCYSYSYQTLAYNQFLDIYKQWYPSGKKTIPKDIKLNSSICQKWYMDDGYIDKKSHYIILATCGFSILNVERLIQQLNNLGFKSNRRTSDNSIHISTKSTKDFLNYIGKCPVKCYQYKWAI